MTLPTLIKLVHSLSAAEKRRFRLLTRKQTGSKDYLSLFDIINSNPGSDIAFLKEKYKKTNSTSSLNNTAGYLVKILTNSLIQSKVEKDNLFHLFQEMMRVKILQERSLHEEAYLLLKNIRKSANTSQHHIIEYITCREELDHLSNTGFGGITDKTLIEKQMNAKNLLKTVNHIEDHHALFELLKYRLVHSGRISSDEDRKKLNDLMLSEMTLVAAKSKNSFAAEKLHLLFQSFFFIDIGDYQSALKTFYSLNRLFELHVKLLNQPPLDYLSTLTGILDSLHTLKQYGEINYYISKLKQLDQPSYPEYFRYQVRKTLIVYQLAVLTGEQKNLEALDFVRGIDVSVLKMYPMISEERQWELYFFCSLAFFRNKQWKKADSYINQVLLLHKVQPQLLICKAVRLLNIVLYYEKGDTGYLDYEIRSYKLFFRKKHRLLKSETLLFKFILLWPDPRKKKIPQAFYNSISNEIRSLTTDKYENQLLKYFDYTKWIMEKLDIDKMKKH
jgi:hypothetical protein